MIFSAVKFNPNDHTDLFNKFLVARGQPHRVSMDFMPPTGVIIYHYSQPICIGFLIKSDNGSAECSDFVSDPDVPKDLRREAVQYMRNYFALEAKKCGIKVLIVFCENPRHIERLKSIGYTPIETNLTSLGRFLWHSQD